AWRVRASLPLPAPSAGLYKEAYKRDSCGFGLIASLDDAPSHWLVRTAISSLIRLTHRGAIAADGKTGDGCGLLLKRPEGFLRAVAAEAGIELAERFASGLVFHSRQALQAEQARLALARELARQGLEVAGWRAVPVDPGACGAEALKSLPLIEQLFVNCRDAGLDEAAFNRRLFMARRLAEKATSGDPAFHVPSLSADTIVFKGMVMPQHLAQLYPDLADPRLESSVAVSPQRFSAHTLPQWRPARPYRSLARNGLRPARFCITANRCLTIASETGVWDYAPEDVVRKGKLGPGDMIALDLKSGTLLASADIDQLLKSRHPYKSWLKQGVRYL